MWDPDDDIRGELGPTEKLLWAGRPPQGFRLRGRDTVSIPFSLMWGGFAIFWETMVIVNGAPLFFVIWGVPFVLIGLHLMFGRFFVDRAQRRNTVYAVTSERIMIKAGVLRRKVVSLDLETLTDLALVEHGNGAGAVVFGSDSKLIRTEGQAGSGKDWRSIFPAFDLESDARTIYELIRTAQREAKSKALVEAAAAYENRGDRPHPLTTDH
jgi:hypothetical protein